MITDSDIIIIQGENDPPVIWQFLISDIPADQEPQAADLFDLTGSVAWLKITDKGVTLVEKNSDDDAELVLDVATATVTWTPTLAETHALPLGRLARYGLERRVGATQGRLAAGYCNVTVDPNDD